MFFEDNPSFSEVLVNRNQFEMVVFGIFVHPALVGPPVDGTCNWWGAADGPGPVGPGSGGPPAGRVMVSRRGVQGQFRRLVLRLRRDDRRPRRGWHAASRGR